MSNAFGFIFIVFMFSLILFLVTSGGTRKFFMKMMMWSLLIGITLIALMIAMDSGKIR